MRADTCCSTFLKDFEPVSVRMAKDQQLPVNPLRIAGACGRLMCCLKYEHPLYQDFQKKAPKLGASVETPEGPGTVVGHSVPADKVVVRLSEDALRVPARQRVRVAAGVRGQVHARARAGRRPVDSLRRRPPGRLAALAQSVERFTRNE